MLEQHLNRLNTSEVEPQLPDINPIARIQHVAGKLQLILKTSGGGMIRPTPRLNSSLLAALPQNGFLGIEQREILEFLEEQRD